LLDKEPFMHGAIRNGHVSSIHSEFLQFDTAWLYRNIAGVS
jgi:hypothetical protein